MMSGILLISIFAGIATSALAFHTLKLNWGFSMAEFRNAFAELVALPEVRREPELQRLFDIPTVIDRSASVFLVYSLLEVPQVQDIASAREGNYAPVIPEGHAYGVCRFYLN